MAVNLKGRSFLTLMDFTPEEIRYMLDLAHDLKAKKRAGIHNEVLKGKNIVLLFEKTSTRTRCAFEVAALDEGAHVTFLDSKSSQMGKKETIADTAKVLGRFYDGIEYRGYKQSVVEELAANAEKECDAAIAKAQEADAALQRAENAELDAGTAKAENAAKDKIISSLEKELNAKKEEADKKDASIKEYKELIKSFTEDASKKVSYEDYRKLREFAERAVRLLSEKRSTIGKLQAENLSLKEELKLSERRLTALVDKQMKEEAAAKEYQKKILEARQNTERKIQESKERELVENAKPEVLSYYEDLVARGEDVAHMREAILRKKTLFEAQTFFLKNKHHKVFEEQKFANTDLSVQIAGGRGTQVNTEINLPKGFIYNLCFEILRSLLSFPFLII